MRNPFAVTLRGVGFSLLNSQMIYKSMKISASNSQCPRALCLPPAALTQCPEYESALEAPDFLFVRTRQLGVLGTRCEYGRRSVDDATHGRRQKRNVHRLVFRQNYGTLHNIFQLAHVPRPGVLLERLESSL